MFWSSLMSGRTLLSLGIKQKMHLGDQIRVWEDPSIPTIPARPARPAACGSSKNDSVECPHVRKLGGSRRYTTFSEFGHKPIQ